METLGEWLQAAVPWLVAGWVLGVVLLSGRLAVGWLRLRRTCAGCGEALEVRLGARLRELQHRLRLSRPARVVQSALVQVPTLLGWFRPVILLPASTLTGLSPVQLDLILAHELAHLRRWDHWVNLFQLAVETLLFYHPAVWWVSRRVREDREHCCDELAVAVCGNRLAYAQALATLEELRQTPAKLALTAADGSLLARIRRILSLPDDERGGGRLSAAGVALVVGGLLMFVAGAFLYATAERRYTATTRVAIDPESKPPQQFSRTQQDQESELDYYSSLFKSWPVLTEVVQQLELAVKWSTGEGAQLLSLSEAVDRLNARLDVRRIAHTRLFDIQAHSSDPSEAQSMATAVVEACRNRILGDHRVRIEALERELTRQSNRVATLRQQAEDLRARYNLDLLGEGRAGGRSRSSRKYPSKSPSS